MGRLTDKVALITGSDSGIGHASAVEFAREGAEVAVSRLAAQGLRVALVERELIGGECAYWGVHPVEANGCRCSSSCWYRPVESGASIAASLVAGSGG